MIPLRYIVGDATRPDGDNPKILAHVCNDVGRWGRGFVLAVSARWPEPERHFRSWSLTGQVQLGQIQLVQVERDMWVANMIGQSGVRGPGNARPVRYAAIDECLERLAAAALKHEASVHMPFIGCGLAGGQWSRIEPLITNRLCDLDVPVTVYRH